MQPDTGESTASIEARADASVIDRVLGALQRPGATLVKPPKLTSYFVDFGDGPVGEWEGGGRLSPAAVKRLERDKKIKWVGTGRYALIDGASS